MDFEAARLNMVNSQLLTNRVTDDGIIAVLGDLPRERFVAEDRRTLAYCDEDVPLGEGRFLMEPMVLALLMQNAAPTPSDVTLVVGCASGYAAAVLGRLVSAVVAVESDRKLVARATENLSALGIDNVAVVESAIDEGYPKQAPYDLIFVDGGIDEVPPAIVDQLGEGGRLVAVVRDALVGCGVLVTRFGGAVSYRECFNAAVPMLPGFAQRKAFAF